MPIPLNYGQQWRQNWRRPLLLAAVIVALLPLSWMGLRWGMRPQVGRNPVRPTAPTLQFPPDAKNLSCYVGGAYDPVPLACEFDCPEASFRAWAEGMGRESLEARSGGIVRHDWTEAHVEHGLFCAWQHENQTRTIAYDLDTGRAYYYWCTR